jgi:hypothetical protein
MIDLGKPPLHGEGVAVFRDHANAGLFYYLPDSPRLRIDSNGKFELSLLKYRLDPSLNKDLGGGLLSLTVDLAVDDDSLAKVRKRIVSHLDTETELTLSPVSADSGSCELILIDQKSGSAAPATAGPGTTAAPVPAGASGLGLVQRIMSSASPALYGDNACTFSAALSAEGTTLVESALVQGGLPLGVIYSLTVTGLRPAMHAQITARWSDVYDYYDNRLHGGKLLLAVDIGPTLEDLVHSEAIQIKVDDLIPDANKLSVYQQALDWVERYVVTQFFKPTLGQQPPAGDDSDGPLQTIGKTLKDLAGLFSINYTLRQVDRNELKTFSYRLDAAEAEQFILSPQGNFGVLLGPESSTAGKYVIALEEPPPAEMKFDVSSVVDLPTEHIDHIEGALTYGGDEQQVVLDGAHARQKVSVWYKQELGAKVGWRYSVDFQAGIGGLNARLSSAAIQTDDRFIMVNPRELYRHVRLEIVAMGLPFDRYPTVVVDLKAADPAAGWSDEATVTLTDRSREASYTVRAGVDAKVFLQRRVRYLDPQGGEQVLDWDDAGPALLPIGDPLPALSKVEILGSARFGTVVRRIIVEMRPKSAPDQVATFVLTAAQPSAEWARSLAAGADLDYEYRVTLYTAANEVREGQWLPGAPGKLIVGEGIARLRQVQMIFVGQTLARMKLLALKVRFSFEDPQSNIFAEEEMLVQDTSKPLQWAYPVADPLRQQYTYQITAIQADGSIKQSDPIASGDLLIIRPLPL